MELIFVILNSALAMRPETPPHHPMGPPAIIPTIPRTTWQDFVSQIADERLSSDDASQRLPSEEDASQGPLSFDAPRRVSSLPLEWVTELNARSNPPSPDRTEYSITPGTPAESAETLLARAFSRQKLSIEDEEKPSTSIDDFNLSEEESNDEETDESTDACDLADQSASVEPSNDGQVKSQAPESGVTNLTEDTDPVVEQGAAQTDHTPPLHLPPRLERLPMHADLVTRNASLPSHLRSIRQKPDFGFYY